MQPSGRRPVVGCGAGGGHGTGGVWVTGKGGGQKGDAAGQQLSLVVDLLTTQHPAHKHKTHFAIHIQYLTGNIFIRPPPNHWWWWGRRRIFGVKNTTGMTDEFFYACVLGVSGLDIRGNLDTFVTTKTWQKSYSIIIHFGADIIENQKIILIDI